MYAIRSYYALRSGDIEIGLEPGIYVNSDADFNLFVHGGVGITKGVDMALKLGVMGTQAYFGGDVEFGLSRNFSVAAGAHSYGVFGLDAMGLYTFNLGDHSKLYTGLDADLNFPENADMQLPVWLPVGVEIPVKKYILFRMEAEVSLTVITSYSIHYTKLYEPGIWLSLSAFWRTTARSIP